MKNNVSHPPTSSTVKPREVDQVIQKERKQRSKSFGRTPNSGCSQQPQAASQAGPEFGTEWSGSP